MQHQLDLAVHPDEADDEGIRRTVCRILGVDPQRLTHLDVERRSIDARGRQVRVRYRVRAFVDEALDEHAPHAEVPELPRLTGEPRVIIVGAGPCGLFAAWALARLGIRSVLLERGADVRGRRPHLARLNREGVLDPDSNYCFGEGGAGTYSDGKLYTRATKRGPVRDVLELLIACGAPASVRVDTRPHIGTNRLPKVVSALRERLVDAGVVVRFETRVVELLCESGRLDGVVLADGEAMRAPATVLATGHSARDIYRLLARHRVAITAKPFALGVRIEHPQPLIDRIQYGDCAGHPNLGAAPYALKRTTEGIGVWSFCMCPGGFIVAAATEGDGVVVNGMSPSRRNSRYANSGMVVGVGPAVFGDAPLAGMEYQARIERAAFQAGGGRFRAPAQRMTDYLAGRVSSDLPPCSYRPGLEPVDLAAILPPRIDRPLREALRAFDERRMRGYLTADAVMVGVESRSSAPIRINRDHETLQSPSHDGLFPAGEGAGFAGGIVSAALDGRRVAVAVARQLGVSGLDKKIEKRVDRGRSDL